MEPNSPLLAISSCENEAQAAALGEWLVQEKLAACVNIVPGLHSIYRWQDELEQSNEVLLLIKTNQQLFERIKIELPPRHPYELPELIAVSIDNALPSYLQWMQNQLSNER